MNDSKSKENDVRYKAAEEKIRTAFYELLREEGFQKVTVRMIVERAGINRSTFYLHYQDKYDLLESIEEELSGGIAGMAMKMVPDGFDAAAILPLSKEIIRWVWENREWFSVLDGPNGDQGFLPRHAERMRALMYSKAVMTVEEEYIEAVMIGMVLQFLRTWIRRDFAESPEELQALIMKTALGVTQRIGGVAASQAADFLNR